MKAIIFGCKYPQITPHFAHLWNKYYSSDIEVTVLSPSDLPKLPENFTHFKLSNFTKSWVNDISEFFDQFEDDHFFACMEDHFLYEPVKQEILNIAEKHIIDGVYKFGCRIGPIPQIPRWALDTPGIQFGPYLKDSRFSISCPVKQSLMPSIWKTEFFKLLLQHSKDYTAWEFETRPKTQTGYELEPEIRELIKDKDFLFYQSPEPFTCIDLIRGGQDNYNEWSRLVKPEDEPIFSSARKVVFP